MSPISVLVAISTVLLAVEATPVVGTISSVGVGAASAAFALAGVVGLALGAGAVGAKVLAARDRRRGRRDLALEQRQEMLFDSVAASDAYGCALKLVCLIEAKSDSETKPEDELIIDIFGRQPDVAADNETSTPRQDYFYAASVGVRQGSNACRRTFSTCHFTYDQMMNYVRALRS